jgi:hypothetical protein
MRALQFATATANLASQNAFLVLATHGPGPVYIAPSSSGESATLIQCGFQYCRRLGLGSFSAHLSRLHMLSFSICPIKSGMIFLLSRCCSAFYFFLVCISKDSGPIELHWHLL